PVYRLSSVLLSLLAIGSPAYCLSLSLLSLPSAAHLRPLPSFPTRRSSDLSRFRTYSLFLFGRAVRPEEACLRTAGYEIRRIEERDRKSTRLNSSHVSISYAVFCLKKKKRRQHGMQQDELLSSNTAGTRVRT